MEEIGLPKVSAVIIHILQLLQPLVIMHCVGDWLAKDFILHSYYTDIATIGYALHRRLACQGLVHHSYHTDIATTGYTQHRRLACQGLVHHITQTLQPLALVTHSIGDWLAKVWYIIHITQTLQPLVTHSIGDWLAKA